MADADNPTEYERPLISVDIASPHIKGADVLSVAATTATCHRLDVGGAILRIKGEETRIEVWIDEGIRQKLIAALEGE